MKLDYDCLRYILLAIEDTDKSRILASSLTNDTYSKGEILHHVDCLKDVHYIETSSPMTCLDAPSSDCYIFRLTMQGHQFLDTIRNDTVWKETKKITSKIGTATLDVIIDIASKVLSDIIAKQMGLN